MTLARSMSARQIGHASVVANAHVGAAPGRIARAPQLEAERRKPLVMKLGRVGGERLGLRPQPVDAGLGDDFAPSSIATSAGTFGVPVRKPAQAARRLVVRSPISNCCSCPNQPLIGLTCGQSESSRTYRKPGAPGPPFRYL